MSSPTVSGASVTVRPTPTDGGILMEDTGTVEREIGHQAATFDWKVKDFSEILGRGRCLLSPEFHFCGHTWHLRLETAKDYILLALWSDDPCPAVDIQFSLGLLSASGKTEMEAAGIHSFNGGKQQISVLSKMIKESEFSRRRVELCPLDVLTIRTSLKEESPAEGPSHSNATTRPMRLQTMVEDFGTVERVDCRQGAVFVWKVQDFSKILDSVAISYSSPKFHFRGHTCWLLLATYFQSDKIALFLCSDDPGPAVDIQFSLGIRSASGKTKMEVAGVHFFNGGKDMIWVSGRSLKKSELFMGREELFPLDVLTITASLKIKSSAEGAYQDGNCIASL